MARWPVSLAAVVLVLLGVVITQAADPAKPPADPWAGTFTDELVTLELRRDGTAYSGTYQVGFRTFPATAKSTKHGLILEYDERGETVRLTIQLQDGKLIFSDGPIIRALTRTGEAPPPPPGPVDPPGPPPTPDPKPDPKPLDDLPIAVLEARRTEVRALQDQTNALLEARRLKEAIAAGEKWVDLCRRYRGDGSADVATSSTKLAEVYLEAGRDEAAEPLLKKALAIRERVYPPDDQRTIGVVNNLAYLYLRKRDFKSAEPLLQRDLESSERVYGPNDTRTAGALNNLGGMYHDQGNFAAALPLAKRAVEINLKILPRNHPEIITGLNNVAANAIALGTLDEAAVSLTRALAAAGETIESTENVTTLSNLGFLHKTKGDFAAAERFTRRAVAAGVKHLRPDDPWTAQARHYHMMSLAALKRYAEALPVARAARQSKLTNRERMMAFASDREQAAYLAEAYKDRDAPLTLVMDHLSSDPAAPPAVKQDALLLAAEVALSDKGIMLESAITRAAAAAEGDPQVAAMYARWRSIGADVARLALANPPPHLAEMHRQRLQQLTEQLEASEKAVAAASARFAADRSASRVTVKQVAAALPREAALVEYVRYMPNRFDARLGEPVVGDLQYAAVILFGARGAPEGTALDIRAIRLGPAAVIDSAVEKWRTSVSRGGGDRGVGGVRAVPAAQPDLATINAELARLVWRPVAALLAGRQQVYVSPDGALAFVPLAALPGHSAGKLVLEEFDLAYVATGRDLVRPPASNTGPALVMGHPDYGEPSTDFSTTRPDARHAAGPGHFEPLAGTKAEVETVAKLLRAPPPLMGTAADEAAVKSARRPSILHLATHGFFLRAGLTDPAAAPYRASDAQGSQVWDRLVSEGPMRRSGIALAGANDVLSGRREAGGNDGILTAEEVAGLDLWGTRLATLSACESGLGDLSISEGVYGLRRAFTQAGAQNLVMSLWCVDDKATAWLIQTMYSHIARGETPQRALLAAQRQYLSDLRKSGNQPHPYFWAAFIASGTGTGLDGTR